MLKVAVLTESRADYGIYYPLLKAMQADCKRFEMHLLVTGMHIDFAHGQTAQQIDFDLRPWRGRVDADWLIVLGDRRPMLDAAIGAAYEGIPVAHLYGGDRSGTIDDACRRAITAFAHLHFPCTQASADRLRRMGEEPWRINVCGPLGVYAIKDAQFQTKAQVCQSLKLDEDKEIVLVIQHPVSTQADQSGEQIRQTLEAVRGLQTVVIYPNNDPGSAAMIREIEACEWVHKFPSLPYLQFLSLLKCSDVIVGNSSCGLYEAPLFGIPALDIGDRQHGREHGNNVGHMPHKAKEIRLYVDLNINTKHPDYGRVNPFHLNIDGPKVILDTLASTPINERLMQKRLTF